MVHEFLGVEVKKGHSYSDWAARPLSPSQLAYALDDVRYLPALHDRMVERWAREGRLSWIEPKSPRCPRRHPMRRIPSWSTVASRGGRPWTVAAWRCSVP